MAGNGCFPELAFFFRAARIGENNRQGHFTFAEIIAPILAHLRGIGIVINRIIHQLEGDTQVSPVTVERHFLHIIAFGHDCGNAAGGSKQCGGFCADDGQIAFFAGFDLALRGQLVHFAFGNDGAGPAEDFQNLQTAVLDHQFKRAAEQEIAHQHGGRVAKDDIGCRLAAPQVRPIHHIIMQQCGRVDKFD